ncbi:MAG: hypothetical protein ACRC7O_06005 [Fimbriiglobus sp.]
MTPHHPGDDRDGTDPSWLHEYLAGRLDPDPPSPAEWARVRRCIFTRLPAPDRPCWTRRIVAGTLTAVAAGVVWFVGSIPDAPQELIPAPVAMAAAPVPREPKAEPTPGQLDLAGHADVTVETIRHDPNTGPAPQVVGGPADAPMIFAAATR